MCYRRMLILSYAPVLRGLTSPSCGYFRYISLHEEGPIVPAPPIPPYMEELRSKLPRHRLEQRRLEVLTPTPTYCDLTQSHRFAMTSCSLSES